MKAGVVLIGLALVAGPVCAAWDRAAGLETNATPSLALADYRLLPGDVIGVPAALATALVAGDVPGILEIGSGVCRAPVSEGVPVAQAAAAEGMVTAQGLPIVASVRGWDVRRDCAAVLAYGGFDAGRGMTSDAGGFACLAGASGVSTDHLMAFRAAGLSANQEVDPFLSMVDVWDAGPLGGLRRVANVVRTRGDQAALGNAASEYWRAMNAAVARRAMLGGRGRRTRAVPVE